MLCFKFYASMQEEYSKCTSVCFIFKVINLLHYTVIKPKEQEELSCPLHPVTVDPATFQGLGRVVVAENTQNLTTALKTSKV